MFQASGTSYSDVSKRTILLLAANPLGTSHLCLGEEERDIRTELQRTRYCNWFDLQSRWAVRYSDVQTALHEITPQIVHFSGHGEGQDGLVFQDENGRAKLINSEALANLFQLCAEHVECVVLNACFSDVQAREIALHIPYVIGMKSAIGDRAAREFSIGFYKALGFGKPYSRACEWGRNAIQLANIPQDRIIVLQNRHQNAASGSEATDLFIKLPDQTPPVELPNQVSEKLDDCQGKVESLKTSLNQLQKIWSHPIIFLPTSQFLRERRRLNTRCESLNDQLIRLRNEFVFDMDLSLETKIEEIEEEVQTLKISINKLNKIAWLAAWMQNLWRRRLRSILGITSTIFLMLILANHPIARIKILMMEVGDYLKPTHTASARVLMSFGERTLLDPNRYNKDQYKLSDKARTIIETEYNSKKEEGMKAFNHALPKSYQKAFDIFDEILNKAKNDISLPTSESDPAARKEAASTILKDPEIRIFRNNARAQKNHEDNPKLPLYTIAVAAPVKQHEGTQILFGVAQAQDKAVNNQGLNLQVLIVDDGNDKNQAKTVAKELANNQQNILAVVGHYTSSSTCSALPFYTQKNLVTISPTSSVFGIRKECLDFNNIFFRTVSSTKKEAESLVNKLLPKIRTSNNPKIVVFHNQELFSNSLFEQFKYALKERNISNIIAHDLSANNFDAKNFSEEIKQANALAVFPDGQTIDGNNSFNNAIDIINQNNGEKPILGSNTLYVSETLNKIKNKNPKNSLLISVDWHPDYPQAKDFVKDANNYWHGDVNYRTALAYEATEVLGKVLKGAKIRLDVKDRLSFNFNEPSSVVTGISVSFDDGDRQEKSKIFVTPIFNTSSNTTSNPIPKFCIVDSASCKTW